MEGVFYQTLGIGLCNPNYNMGWKNKAHDQDQSKRESLFNFFFFK